MKHTRREQRLRRYWDKQSGSYDRQMGFFDRKLFGDTRSWICSRTVGDVLEVAIGTGLNLTTYPDGIRLTGVEWSPAMLEIARQRAADLGVTVDLREGDAQDLDFPDASFDTVVCTFSLSARSPTNSGRSPRWPGYSGPADYSCWPTTWPPRLGRSGRFNGSSSW